MLIRGPFSSTALAEHALFLMLCLTKNFSASQKSIRAKALCQPVNRELTGKTLGLIGFGASGRELAKRAWAMGMHIMAVDKQDFSSTILTEFHLDFLDGPSRLSDVLKQADYVSLHVPLTSETRYMIDGSALEIMKRTAFLINVARGELIDESDLITALRNGRIAGGD